MATVGVICEYDPFHNGHLTQFETIRRQFGPRTRIVCAMSGNFVQRGAPAVFDKLTRAEAAVRCGADLVLELPVTAALRSAEGFADAGVRILTDAGCDALSCGIRGEDDRRLMRIARLLLEPETDREIRGLVTSHSCSYPAARQAVLEAHGMGELTDPNEILAVEYCKAMLRQGSGMELFAVTRPGDYHDRALEPAAPSATAIRLAMARGEPWQAAVPEALLPLYAAARRHSLRAGERAVLARVRTLTDAEFEALPFGSEGLWRRFLRACRSSGSVEQILEQTKSKRYTRTRLQRMLMCAYLGISRDVLSTAPPYVRALAFNDAGRELLRQTKRRCAVVDAGQTPRDAAYYALECRAADLYALFSEEEAGLAPGTEQRLRNRYLFRIDPTNKEE